MLIPWFVDGVMSHSQELVALMLGLIALVYALVNWNINGVSNRWFQISAVLSVAILALGWYGVFAVVLCLFVAYFKNRNTQQY